jgi:hypothetical protein
VLGRCVLAKGASYFLALGMGFSTNLVIQNLNFESQRMKQIELKFFLHRRNAYIDMYINIIVTLSENTLQRKTQKY